MWCRKMTMNNLPDGYEFRGCGELYYGANYVGDVNGWPEEGIQTEWFVQVRWTDAGQDCEADPYRYEASAVNALIRAYEEAGRPANVE